MFVGIPGVKTRRGSSPEAGVWAACSPRSQREEKHVAVQHWVPEGLGDEAGDGEALPASPALESCNWLMLTDSLLCQREGEPWELLGKNRAWAMMLYVRVLLFYLGILTFSF